MPSDEAKLWADVGRALFGDDYRLQMASALGIRKDFVAAVARGQKEAREGHWTDLLQLLRERAQGLQQRADTLKATADRVEAFILTAREHEE